MGHFLVLISGILSRGIDPLTETHSIFVLQAALLLVNLTSQPLGGSSEEAGARYGPVVHDEHSQVGSNS